MRETAKAVLTAALLAAGLLAGCTRTQPASSPAAPPASLSEAAVDMVTRSGSYPDQLWQVTKADEKLTEQCMRAAGLNWTGGSRPPVRQSNVNALANARRNGYGMSDATPAADTAEQADAAAEDDPRLRTALLGPYNDLAHLTIDGHATYWFPRTGCAAQAHISVYGSLETWARISYLPQEVNLTLDDQARTDSRYQTALQQWRTCMAAHHYTYTSPTDIVDQLAARYRSDREPLAPRKSAEIALAVQDLTCDQQTGLTATRDALRRQYAQRLNPRELGELTRLAELFAQARQRAPI